MVSVPRRTFIACGTLLGGFKYPIEVCISLRHSRPLWRMLRERGKGEGRARSGAWLLSGSRPRSIILEADHGNLSERDVKQIEVMRSRPSTRLIFSHDHDVNESTTHRHARHGRPKLNVDPQVCRPPLLNYNTISPNFRSFTLSWSVPESGGCVRRSQ